MKKNICFLLIVLFLGYIPNSAQTISYDAVILTLRIQDGIWLDSTLAIQIDSALKTVVQFDENLSSCHVFPSYDPYDLIVKTDTVITNWNAGILATGIPDIDSLNTFFKATSVHRVLSYSTYYTISFANPLHIIHLKAKYLESNRIISASANGNMGDGNNIYLLKKPDGMHFIFKFGWGDCMSGCAYKEYWYYTLDSCNNVLFEEYLPDEQRADLRIFRWDIPAIYSMTMFPNPDSIYATLKTTDKWWIKRHCLEGIYRFYKYDYKWSSIDKTEPFDSLRQAVTARLADNLAVIQEFTNDRDADVVNTAEKAYNYLVKLNITKDQSNLLNRFDLYPAYPNPFNSSTTIHYSLVSETMVAIMIYNINGQNIEIIDIGRQNPGEYFIKWGPENLAGGIYFIQLHADNYERTQKCMYIR